MSGSVVADVIVVVVVDVLLGRVWFAVAGLSAGKAVGWLLVVLVL